MAGLTRPTQAQYLSQGPGKTPFTSQRSPDKCGTEKQVVSQFAVSLHTLTILLHSTTAHFGAGEKARWLRTLAALPGTQVQFPAPVSGGLQPSVTPDPRI